VNKSLVLFTMKRDILTSYYRWTCECQQGLMISLQLSISCHVAKRLVTHAREVPTTLHLTVCCLLCSLLQFLVILVDWWCSHKPDRICQVAAPCSVVWGEVCWAAHQLLTMCWFVLVTSIIRWLPALSMRLVFSVCSKSQH